MKHPRPYVGKVYEELTVVKIDYGVNLGIKRIYCKCICGSVTDYFPWDVMKGFSKRCAECRGRGISESKKIYDHIVKDDALRRRLLVCINDARHRCTNPKAKSYYNYGGRGITVKFKDNAEFLAHLITLDGYDNPNLQLDRENNNGHYEPGNLRFVTPKVNINNRIR